MDRVGRSNHSRLTQFTRRMGTKLAPVKGLVLGCFSLVDNSSALRAARRTVAKELHEVPDNEREGVQDRLNELDQEIAARRRQTRRKFLGGLVALAGVSTVAVPGTARLVNHFGKMSGYYDFNPPAAFIPNKDGPIHSPGLDWRPYPKVDIAEDSDKFRFKSSGVVSFSGEDAKLKMSSDHFIDHKRPSVLTAGGYFIPKHNKLRGFWEVNKQPTFSFFERNIPDDSEIRLEPPELGNQGQNIVSIVINPAASYDIVLPENSRVDLYLLKQELKTDPKLKLRLAGDFSAKVNLYQIDDESQVPKFPWGGIPLEADSQTISDSSKEYKVVKGGLEPFEMGTWDYWTSP